MINFYLKYELVIAFILLIAGFVLYTISEHIKVCVYEDSDSVKYRNPKKVSMIYMLAGILCMALALLLGFRGGYIQESFKVLVSYFR